MDKVKLEQLKKYFQELGSAAIAFSSGVDSTFMLKVAHDVLGDRVIAVTAVSQSLPERELLEAEQFCKNEKIRHIVIKCNQFSIPGFSENPANRCYICKRFIFEKILSAAKENNIDYVCEGSNLDDVSDYRPGLAAIEELGIKSPLRYVNLTKKEIRCYAEELNLPVWNKPAFACLSTRIMYNEKITEQKLKMIDRAEQFLLESGFSQFRVRLHGENLARIEVLPEELEKLFLMRDKVIREFSEIGFVFTSMDLKGYRTGSMNETLGGKNE